MKLEERIKPGENSSPAKKKPQVRDDTQLVTVTFIAGAPAIAKSGLAAADDLPLVADNKATKNITLTLRDAFSNPVTDKTVVFSSTNSGVMSTTTNHQDGTYSAALSGIKSGNAEISVTIDGQIFAIAKVKVTMIGDVTTAKFNLPNITQLNITSAAHPDIMVRVVDANDNVLPGQTVTRSTVGWADLQKITDDNGSTLFPIVGPDWNGHVNYIFRLDNRVSYTIDVHYNGG
jgi:adhesin/invasin